LLGDRDQDLRGGEGSFVCSSQEVVAGPLPGERERKLRGHFVLAEAAGGPIGGAYLAAVERGGRVDQCLGHPTDRRSKARLGEGVVEKTKIGLGLARRERSAEQPLAVLAQELSRARAVR